MSGEEKRKLYVIVPAFNEKATVYALLDRVAGAVLPDAISEKRIILVDDGSTDGMPEEIRRFRADHPAALLTEHRLEQNRGKGFAIREALKFCEDDEGIVLIQDADLEYDPADYATLLMPILRGEHRVVFGSRRLHRRSPSRSGWLYSLGGLIENIFLHMLYRTGVTDIATGYKLVPAGVMKELNLTSTGFEFCPEVTAKLLNRSFSIYEVPISYHARRKSEGKKIKWTDLFVGLMTLLRVKLLKE